MKSLLAALALPALLLILNLPATALAQGTAFTYQGQLDSSGAPANGSYDFAFTLYTTNVTGSQIAGPVTNTAVGVTNGLFTTTIDFGNVFVGTSNWLEIAVSVSGANSFTTLAPRQQLTPVPYAIMANSASNLLGSLPVAQLIGTVSLTNLPVAVITNNETGVNITVNNLSVTTTNEIAPLTVTPKVQGAVGSVSGNVTPDCVVVAGRYAYVITFSSLDSSLEIFDVSVPSHPVHIGTVATGTEPMSVAVAGRYAYVANNTGNNLQVIDVSDPAVPVIVGSVSTESNPDAVAVSGQYIYVGSNSGYLQIFNASNPSKPVLVGSANTGGAINFISVSGRYAYMVTFSSLLIYDVSNPAIPASVSSISIGSTSQSLAISGRYAYVANSAGNLLQIFDVSNPASPVLTGSAGTGSNPYSVAVAGRYAYVVNESSDNLQVFDVSNPSSPISVGTVGTGFAPESIAVSGRYAYVANFSSTSLQIFDLGGAYIQQLEAGSTETGTLQTRDTATVGNNLDVRGGLTVSSSARITGGFSADAVMIGSNNAVVSAENLRIVRGTLGAIGNIEAGAGFTVSHVPLSGVYNITFTPSFSGIPTVTATAADLVAKVSPANTNTVTISTMNLSGSAEDDSFQFIAIGPP